MKNRWFLTAIGVLVLTVVCAGLWYAFTMLQPVSLTPVKKSTFTLPPEASVIQTADLLENKHFIKSSLAFQLLIWKNKLSSRLQSGTFLLSPSMTLQQISLELTTEPTSVRVTVKEGLRREELADFFASVPELTAFNKAEFLKLTAGKEGKLFPDTYVFSKEISTQALVNQLTSTFDKKISGDLAESLQSSKHSLQDVITVASLVQREARGPVASATDPTPDPAEMKMIAGIFWKRISLGIPLGVDATLQYVKGYDAANDTWWSDKNLVDIKKSASPYNSYKFAGLPPSPICNPGLFALQAAAAPTESDYLFYLHDQKGVAHYAKTLEEHNQNVDTYLR